MKKTLRLFTCALAAISTLGITSASAQTLYVKMGDVTVAHAVSDLGEMTFGGISVQIGDITYYVSDIDAISYSDDTVTPQTVSVAYNGSSATTVITADVFNMLNYTLSGADVSFTQNPSLEQEINYVLSGTSTNGSFFMDGDYKATVTLNGLNLASTSGYAIDIENGKRIDVVLADGTTNTLSDAASGTQKACFMIDGHPEFSGSGTLSITGNAKHAFAADEYTLLKSSFTGTINVLGAASDGLHIGQYLEMRNGNIVFAAAPSGDGIDVDSTKTATDELNGQILISGGNITIPALSDDTKGLKSASHTTISGGTLQITASGNGTKGISVGGNLLVNNADGATSINVTASGTTYAKGTVDESKCRGIKVKGNFTFNGGNIAVSATGTKAKAVVVDGTYTYQSGTINCSVQDVNS